MILLIVPGILQLENKPAVTCGSPNREVFVYGRLCLTQIWILAPAFTCEILMTFFNSFASCHFFSCEIGIKFTFYKYYSAIQRDEVMPFAVTWMDLEIIKLSEIHQTEKDKYLMISLICGIWNKWFKGTYLQIEVETLRHRKLMVTKGERQGR